VKRFTLRTSEFPEMLRTIGRDDLEDLRHWKNANTAGFFFKDQISSDAQAAWFEGYAARPHDYMFIVGSPELRAGCMGFRLQNGAADAYNVISLPVARGHGMFGRAMRLMCSYITREHTRRIGCLVLKDNPAVRWYLACGYRIAVERPDHFEMALDLSRFEPCEYTRDVE
jgi:ribosomal protein S18 acetylase RimI-like enzyme